MCVYLISLHSLFYGICHVVAFALFSLFLFVSLWHAFVGSQNIYMGAGRRKFTRTHTQRTLKIYIARVLVRHTHIFYVLCHFVFALFFVSRPAHLATCSLKISTRTDSPALVFGCFYVCAAAAGVSCAACAGMRQVCC